MTAATDALRGEPAPLPPSSGVTAHKHGGLSQLPASAICGNDITSSVLYVSALATLAAGKYAWISLLIVAGVLFLYRFIYAEVVGALPLNGGAYNALLNTTSKSLASVAAALTILSYMATAVISATEAMHYAEHLWHGLPIIPATLAVLAVFMVLTILGITESARVAVAIFLFHMATLSVLLLLGLLYVATSGISVLQANMAMPAPHGFGVVTALFVGFSAALLGISGFESSANYVEEQAEGVFPLTLRNMWLAVSFFNPVMALLVLAIVPLPEVADHTEALLAHMGFVSGGGWLRTLVSVDATLVLSGAVLTSFIGVTGLMRRMALDRVMPQFMLQSNRRGTPHWIILGFFLLGVSVLLITQAEVQALAGVYTISFLAVMILFAVGNVLLKVKRSRLPRPSQAGWPTVIVAIVATVLGLLGIVLMNPDYTSVFLGYFLPAMVVIWIMLRRIDLLRILLFVVRSISQSLYGATRSLTRSIQDKIDEINAQQFVFFTRGDDTANLNRVMRYVVENEHTNRIKVVTVVSEEGAESPQLREDLQFLDRAYTDIEIEYVVLVDRFGPELIQRLSAEWNIPPNFMFIGSPGNHFLYGLAELGGVRLIV